MQRKVNLQGMETHILALKEQENDARNALGMPESTELSPLTNLSSKALKRALKRRKFAL